MKKKKIDEKGKYCKQAPAPSVRQQSWVRKEIFRLLKPIGRQLEVIEQRETPENTFSIVEIYVLFFTEKCQSRAEQNYTASRRKY